LASPALVENKRDIGGGPRTAISVLLLGIASRSAPTLAASSAQPATTGVGVLSEMRAEASSEVTRP
jgi:hypothetical protein